MRLIDWLIVAFYLAYIIWSGARSNRNAKEMESYFLANRSLPWWAVGLSVMATQLSAITLVGTTGQAYDKGTSFVQFYYGLPFAMIILSVTVVPFFYRARVYTAYEYLERRFDVKTRTLTSLFFLVSRGLGCGVVIAAPSVILSIVLGWNEILTIFVMGLGTTIYTMFGGVQAVTWTDVKQMVLIFFALTVCMVIIVSQFPSNVSITDAFYLAGATGRLETVDLKFDLKNQYNIWSGLIGGLFLMLAYFGTDQSQVQRYLTSKSLGEARTSLLMSAFLKVPMQFLILMIGVMVFIFYQFQPPPVLFNPVDAKKVESDRGSDLTAIQQEYGAAFEHRRQSAIGYIAARGTQQETEALARYRQSDSAMQQVRKKGVDLAEQATGKKYNDVNYVFPGFILKYMPIGVVGLLIAAIMAAAMSTISAELNALATASTIDFYRRLFRPDMSDGSYVTFGKFATGFWGLFACVVAMYATSLGSLIEVVNRFGSFFYGSLLGVFVLALAVPRATGRGAFWGLLFGITAVAFVSRVTDIAFLWFNVIGCFVVVIAGFLISLTGPKRASTVQA